MLVFDWFCSPTERKTIICDQYILLLVMSSRNELDLEQKLNLIKNKDDLSYREIKNKLEMSLNIILNVLKRKNVSVNDSETN